MIQVWLWSLLETSAAATRCSPTTTKIPLSSMTRQLWTTRTMKTRMTTTSMTNTCRNFGKKKKKAKQKKRRPQKQNTKLKRNQKRKLFVWSNCTFPSDSPKQIILLKAYGRLSVYHFLNWKEKRKKKHSGQRFRISLPLRVEHDWLNDPRSRCHQPQNITYGLNNDSSTTVDFVMCKDLSLHWTVCVFSCVPSLCSTPAPGRIDACGTMLKRDFGFYISSSLSSSSSSSPPAPLMAYLKFLCIGGMLMINVDKTLGSLWLDKH